MVGKMPKTRIERRRCLLHPGRSKAGLLLPLLRLGCAAFAVGLALLAAPAWAAAADVPPSCPTPPTQVVRSSGAVVDYLGSVPGIPDLCRMRRSSDGEGDFYLGVWRVDWPGAGQAYPAVRAAIYGPKGTRTDFVTRSAPGLQWIDSYTNEGVETVTVNDVPHRTLRIAHEREGIEGNTYHSVITHWLDIATGAMLKTVEHQISGQSYGPNTTWDAIRLEAPHRPRR